MLPVNQKLIIKKKVINCLKVKSFVRISSTYNFAKHSESAARKFHLSSWGNAFEKPAAELLAERIRESFISCRFSGR